METKRSYLITMDTKGRWNSSSIPQRACSSISGRDTLSKNSSSSTGKNCQKSEETDRRTWIWFGGWDSSEIFSSGFNYVALQGKDTMCLVTGDKKMDKGKYRMCMGEIITEIKVNGLYGYSKRESRKYLGMLPEDEDLRPFAAVNVVLGTKEVSAEIGNEALNVGLKEKEVIGILMRKVQKGTGFSYKETIQTAISALLKMESKACRVKVCVWKKGACSSEQLTGKEIEEHLEAIKNKEKLGTFYRTMSIIDAYQQASKLKGDFQSSKPKGDFQSYNVDHNQPNASCFENHPIF